MRTNIFQVLYIFALIITLLVFGSCAPDNVIDSDNPDVPPSQDTETPSEYSRPEMLSPDDPLEQMQAQFPDLIISNYYEYLYAQYYYPYGTPDIFSDFISPLISRDATAEGIIFTVEPSHVPRDFESFHIVLRQPNEPYVMEFSDTFRIEKMIDGKWTRICYLRRGIVPGVLDQRAAFYPGLGALDPEYPYFAGGYKEVSIVLQRDEWITPPEPGLYRVLVYAGYDATPIYAEFEILE